MIRNKEGRSRSHRTRLELEEMLQKDMATLSAEEREAVQIIINEMSQTPQVAQPSPQLPSGIQNASLLDILNQAEFKRPLVDIETFVKDPYYLGNTCDNLYPVLLQDLKTLFSGGYHEAVWTGCIDLNSIVQGANGSLRTIREWVGSKGKVLGFAPSGTKAAKTGIAKHSGIQPTMRITLANGMAQRLTPDHKVMTWREGYRWVPTEQLVPGDLVLTPARLVTAPDSDLTENAARRYAQSPCFVVPDAVCRASTDAVAGFLSQLWTAYGEAKLDLSSGSTGVLRGFSELVVRQLQLLLLRFGLRSVVHSDAGFWTVRLTREGVVSSPEGLPSDYQLERVVSVEDAGPTEVGDICDVQELTSFVSNGLYNHNSIGYGKCAVKSRSYITDCTTGRRGKIEEFEAYSPQVPSFSPQGAIEPATASKVWASGRKECARLELLSGQWFEASFDHPVLTPTGYVPLSGLKPDMLVACARSTPAPEKPLKISDAEVLTAAYLIADGALTQGHHIFVKGNRVLVDDFKKHVAAVPGFTGFGTERFRDGAWYVSFLGLNQWMEGLGINCLSRVKRIPPEYFGLPDRQLALFLNRIYTDGHVFVGSNRQFQLTLASEGLIDDVQEALRRFGIVARKYTTPKSIKQEDGTKNWYDAWTLQIADAPSQLLFLNAIGPIIGAEAACERLRQKASTVKSNTNWDIVPITTNELKEIRRETGPHTNPEWLKYGALMDSSYMGRDRFKRLCEKFNYTGKYRWLAEADLVWERVVSVEPIGPQEVYDLTVPGNANAVINGIVVHNTHVSTIGVLRVLYELSCMKDPHKSFGLSQGSNISFVCTSVNETLAVKVVFEAIATKVKASPYFIENFPFEETKKEIRFPGGVWVAARASTDTSALGLNAIGALLDETNFLARTAKEAHLGAIDRAETIYNTIQRRMKSRFERHGKLPGMIFIVSSKKTMDDFTARRIRDARDDPTVFVRDYALWQTKPEDYYSSNRFWVLCGNETVPSKILTDTEYVELKDRVPEGATLLQVPDDFKKDFERDLEGGIRDLGGVATVSINPFIHRREKILEAIDATRSHPFSSLIYDASKGGNFLWGNMVRVSTERNFGDTMTQITRPILNPRALRHIHIDPSLRGDSTGFVMAHVGGWKDVPRRGEDGREFMERAPLYIVDVMLRIVPPTGDEIVLADLRHLVYDISSHGYSITGVTLDSWQCFTGDTRVRLLDGRSRSFEELVEEFGDSRSFWVYSFNGKRIVPGRARNPRKMGTKPVLEVTLDNGETVCCTKDHRWMTRGGNWVQAQHLRVGDALMPLYTKCSDLIQGSVSQHCEELYQPLTDSWEFSHHVTGPALWKEVRHQELQDTGTCFKACCGGAARSTFSNGLSTLRPENDFFIINRRVIAVKAAGQADVYDLTVANYANFALDSGVFVHNSADSIQQLNQRGFNSQILSVDTSTDPYENLKTALYENRVSYYNYPPLIEELQQLERRYDGRKTKIDHPSRGCFIGSTLVWTTEGPRSFEALASSPVTYIGITSNGGVQVQAPLLRPRVTKLTSRLVEVTLNTGDVVTCTPEHLWLLKNGQHKEALFLTAQDELVASRSELRVRQIAMFFPKVPVPVYDLSVPGTENFQLAAGPFVHNSKDVADALAASLFALSTKQTQQPLPILRGISYSGDAWLEEQQQSSYAGNRGAAQNTELLPPFIKGNGNDDGGWSGGGGGWNP